MKKKILYYIYLLGLGLLFILYHYKFSNFSIIMGSDDGIQIHNIRNLINNGIIDTVSTQLQYIYSNIIILLGVEKILYLPLFLNIITLICSIIILNKIIGLFSNIKFLQLFGGTIFLFSSMTFSNLLGHFTNYILPLFFSLISFYFLTKFFTKENLNKELKYLVFIMFFAQISFFTKRLRQIFGLIIILSLLCYIVIKNKKIFFKFIFAGLLNLLILLPRINFKVNKLGLKNFYIDEYNWSFNGDIAKVYKSYLRNPLPSYKLFTDFFSSSYVFYNIGFIFIIFLFIFIFFLNKKIHIEKKILIGTLFLMFITYLILPVLGIGVRPIERYSFAGYFGFVILITIIYGFLYSKYKNIGKIFIILMTLLILSGIPNGFLNKYKNYDINLSQQNGYSTEALKIKKIINSNYNTLFRSYFMEYFMYDFYGKGITYNVFRLDKEDGIKYLSREKGIENILLKKYNIKYIVLYKKQSGLEYGYYPWLNILYKKSLYYKTGLEESKYITKIFDGEYLIVYKIINIYEKQ